MTPRAAKPQRSPIYAVVRELLDDTGKRVPCFVPEHYVDFVACRERKLYRGKRVRLQITEPRNEVFHRAVHVFGRMISEHVAGFEGMNPHAVIKRLQMDGDVCCEYVEMDLEEFGKVRVRQAQSISFDNMDEGPFRLFWKQIVAYTCATHWGGLEPEAIREQSELIAKTMGEG